MKLAKLRVQEDLILKSIKISNNMIMFTSIHSFSSPHGQRGRFGRYKQQTCIFVVIERIYETRGITGRVARYSSRKWNCSCNWLSPRKECGSNVNSRSFRESVA